MRELAAQYGEQITLRTADAETETWAFIQPKTERGETSPGERTAIGWRDRRLWQYIGAEKVQPGETVVWREKLYRVRSSRAYYLDGTLHHWWAMLEEEREAAE